MRASPRSKPSRRNTLRFNVNQLRYLRPIGGGDDCNDDDDDCGISIDVADDVVDRGELAADAIT
jgi:hypothetical protein